MKHLLLVLVLAVSGWAHPGGLDPRGGHFDQASGTYHYHLHNVATLARTTLAAPPYKRTDWMRAWRDEDHNGLNTRAEVLARDERPEGGWLCPYTGVHYNDAAEVDADHVVPLEHVHGLGGWAWTPDQKRAFANDLGNLLAVSARANSAKGSRTPVFWKPRLAYWKAFATRWRAVKRKYRLPLSLLENRELRRMEGLPP
jgi:hypothetical protein